MNPLFLENYAKLIVKSGVNVQKGQVAVISSPIECAPFARQIAKHAYEAGAKDVVMNWSDELSVKERFMHADDSVFDALPSWIENLYTTTVRDNACYISISAADPELLKDAPADRVARAQKARKIALTEFYNRTMANQNTWCVVSVPTATWAQRLFPNQSQEAAVESLWDAIIKAVRADQPDPVAAWDSHKQNLKNYMHFLNENNFKFLKYKNSLGTDLTIELPEGHLWTSGAEHTPYGVEFIANLPTEEVFTLPKRDGVNGIVYSSKPLNYNGNLIDEFSLTLKEGQVVDFTAKKGYEILKNLLDTDPGSRYLGEVALVPYDSPISNSGLLFCNTLFDENASCHLAFGKAYPTCLKDSEGQTPEQLLARGANDSLTHEDFMIGTHDLEIVGIKADGTEIPVFKAGNFSL